MYEHLFFLLYHGKGFTDVGIKQMAMDEVFWASKKLYDQLSAENKAREEEAKKIQRMRR